MKCRWISLLRPFFTEFKLFRISVPKFPPTHFESQMPDSCAFCFLTRTFLIQHYNCFFFKYQKLFVAFSVPLNYTKTFRCNKYLKARHFNKFERPALTEIFGTGKRALQGERWSMVAIECSWTLKKVWLFLQKFVVPLLSGSSRTRLERQEICILF